MSIWTQLQQESKRDKELLDRAMTLLHVIVYKGGAVYFASDIERLTRDVKKHSENDDRFSPGCVPFDITKKGKR